MQITDIDIYPLDSTTARLNWGGVAGNYSYVYVNGQRQFPPLQLNEVDKQIDISVDTSSLFTVDIFEFETSNESPIGAIDYDCKPVLHFTTIAGAVTYRIYAVDEAQYQVLLGEITADVTTKYYSFNVDSELESTNGRMWEFAVVAVDSYGQESSSFYTSYFIEGFPEKRVVTIEEDDNSTFKVVLS